MAENIEIPMDVYESPDEIVLIAPLGWVAKNSIELSLEKTHLKLSWVRTKPNLKENLMALQEESYWWDFEKVVELPQNVYFDKIHSHLTKDNVLVVIIPKVRIPEKIKLEVQFSDM